MSNQLDLIQSFQPISLEEMNDVKLMSRIDTKYVVPVSKLVEFFRMAMPDYLVQEVNGERNIPYRTVYLDTADFQMYKAHATGRKIREKIRVRTYESSNLTFLEVKHKNNHGRTDKKRIRVSSLNSLEADGGETFLRKHAIHALNEIAPRLENHFQRITLVNKAKTERLTIDNSLCFTNLMNHNSYDLGRLAIVELKRDGRSPSPVLSLFRELHVKPSSFSKYCMGCAFTDKQLRQNLFKPNLIVLDKILKNEIKTI